MTPQDFPLAWPEGRPRSVTKTRSQFKISFARAYDQLLDEVEKLHEGDRDVVISTNVPLTKDGLPILGVTTKYLTDPGVAVYLWRGGKPYAIACDTYLEVRHNLRALWYAIKALRTIERHGTAALFEQSMIGFCREIDKVKAIPVQLIAANGLA